MKGDGNIEKKRNNMRIAAICKLITKVRHVQKSNIWQRENKTRNDMKILRDGNRINVIS